MKELYATIDLGSNSFHMLTAALEFDEIKILDSVSDKVMLADGLSKKHGIAEDAKLRGIACIERFAQRLESIPRENIRIIGTNTLRAAVDSNEYVEILESKLGNIPIEIISGVEEARLIFLGVNHTWSSLHSESKQLVIDIGGGSTEFIIGRTFSLKKAESLRMGCVAFRRFFPQETIDTASFDSAEQAAEVELSNILRDFKPKLWTHVIGSAGTFKAIERLAISLGYSEEGITLEALYKIKSRLLEFSSMNEIELEGLKELRKKTILPGVAISIAIFKLLKINTMQISRGGLREGILYDLIGRRNHEDVRERSIAAISKRYGQRANRTKLNHQVVKTLLKNIQKDDADGGQHLLSDRNKKFLLWAASCSQIGLSISHTQYQNHSAYLIKNSELYGFTIKERQILAAIVKSHRRKIKWSSFEQAGLSEEDSRALFPVIFILRLCFIITQNGKKNNCKNIGLKFCENTLTVILPIDWVNQHPLAFNSMSQEIKYWQTVGVKFLIATADSNSCHD